MKIQHLLRENPGFIQSQQLGGAAFWEASGDRQNERSLTTLVRNRYSICRLRLANPLAQMAPNLGGDEVG